MDLIERISNGFLEAKILLAAAELRLFDLLGGGGKTAPEVAEWIGGTLRGTEILLDALVAMEFLDKASGRYRVRPEHAEALSETSPRHTTAILRHRNHMFRRWAFLEEAVLGREAPWTGRSSLDDPEANDAFIRGMYAVSGAGAGAIVDRIDLAGARRVADLGGGPGHYLVEMLRRAPETEGWLVDLPLTLDTSRRMALDATLPRPFHRLAWNFYEEDPPGDLPVFDLVYLSQVVHAESPEANRRLLERLRPHVAPGGRVVVHERTVEEDRATPKAAAIFAVNMLAMTPAGRTYTAGEIASWGEAAGYRRAPGERIDERSELVVLIRT